MGALTMLLALLEGKQCVLCYSVNKAALDSTKKKKRKDYRQSILLKVY